MAPRLFPAIPDAKYLCFYPMDRKRGEQVNWYTVPFAERQRMMHEHGMIGRRYADQVKQIISGSIGMDDWEWGVDLFADDPVVFKKLIYEMRFDEVSAVYALFGQFYHRGAPAGGEAGRLAGRKALKNIAQAKSGNSFHRRLTGRFHDHYFDRRFYRLEFQPELLFKRSIQTGKFRVL